MNSKRKELKKKECLLYSTLKLIYLFQIEKKINKKRHVKKVYKRKDCILNAILFCHFVSVSSKNDIETRIQRACNTALTNSQSMMHDDE